jgi:hypothetical protein
VAAPSLTSFDGLLKESCEDRQRLLQHLRVGHERNGLAPRGVTATPATIWSIDGERPFRDPLISLSFDGG